MKKPKTHPKIVESLAAAASILKVEKHVVRTAKREGCSAFRPGGRVHLVELERYLSKQKKKIPRPQKPLAPLTHDQLAELGGLEASRAAAIRDEIETSRLLQRARETGDSGSIADLTLAVGRARKNRLAVEEAVTALELHRGSLVPLDYHVSQVGRLWAPIVTLMRAVSRKAAVQLADSVHAEKVIAGFVEEAIAGARRSLDSGKFGDYERDSAALALLNLLTDSAAISQATVDELDNIRVQIIGLMGEPFAGITVKDVSRVGNRG